LPGTLYAPRRCTISTTSFYRKVRDLQWYHDRYCYIGLTITHRTHQTCPSWGSSMIQAKVPSGKAMVTSSYSARLKEIQMRSNFRRTMFGTLTGMTWIRPSITTSKTRRWVDEIGDTEETTFRIGSCELTLHYPVVRFQGVRPPTVYIGFPCTKVRMACARLRVMCCWILD
jgi:hypothetical protein